MKNKNTIYLKLMLNIKILDTGFLLILMQDKEGKHIDTSQLII